MVFYAAAIGILSRCRRGQAPRDRPRRDRGRHQRLHPRTDAVGVLGVDRDHEWPRSMRRSSRDDARCRRRGRRRGLGRDRRDADHHGTGGADVHPVRAVHLDLSRRIRPRTSGTDDHLDGRRHDRYSVDRRRPARVRPVRAGFRTRRPNRRRRGRGAHRADDPRRRALRRRCCRLVPNELREASLALGVPKWKTVVKVVLPTAIAGIVTGITLAIAAWSARLPHCS